MYRNKEKTFFAGKYLEISFSYFLEQVMTMPSRVTNHTLTPIDHILINLPNKACHSNVKDFGLSDHNLIYHTRKHTQIPQA